MAQEERSALQLQTAKSHWRDLFYQLSNGSDSIPVSRLYRELQLHHPEVPEHVIRKMAEKADNNRDSSISYDEFLEYVATVPAGVVHPILHTYFSQYVRSFVPKKQRRLDSTDGRYEAEYGCSPPPVFMIFISIVEIALYLFDLKALSESDCPRGPAFSLFIYSPRRRAEFWRFFTYMFVHASNAHLALNVFVQILLGIPLEMVHHCWRIAFIYISGVFFGSLITSVVDPTVYLAGASGGVYALMAAHIATIIINWSEMDHPAIQLGIFLFIGIADVSTAVYDRYFSAIDKKIGYEAHMAGAMAGLLVGIYVLRNLRVKSWEKKLYWVCIVLLVIVAGSAITVNIFYDSHFLPQVPFAKEIFC